MQNPQVISTSHIGTTKGVLDGAMDIKSEKVDEVQELVDDIVDVSVGDLPDQRFGYGSSTMDVAKALATTRDSDWLTRSIYGSTARELAQKATSISITASTGGTSVSIKVSVPKICNASTL